MTDKGGDFSPNGEQPHEEPATNPPVFNMPSLLVFILASLAAVYLLGDYVLPEADYGWFLFTFGFIPLRYAVAFSDQGMEWLWTPVTYSYLHGGLEHLLFNGLWLAAFGAPVLRRIGTTRFVLFWIASSVVSAFGHAFLHWESVTVLIGASGVVSALMGAACRFAFPRDGSRYNPTTGHLLPRQSVLGALSNRTVLIFTGMWMFGNLLFALGIPLIGDIAGEVAWDAHIFGFLFGFILFGVFDRVSSER